MKHTKLLPLLFFVALLSACAHTSLGKLVGSDRDEHGCIGSAGYTWSDALHSCVRLWEAGTRFDNGPEQTFLIFSADSTLAEVFSGESASVLCRRVKDSDVWKPRKGNTSVSIQNGIITVHVNDYSYTRRVGE